jgi:hypothetical protein
VKTGRVAGWAAFGAAMVYVLLKVVWILGSRVGVTDLGGLSRTEWALDNVSTGLLGAAGAVVALATVRPWGMRVPVWLLTVPMWVGAGLLAPFLVLMPAAAVFAAFGWWSPPPTAESAGPTLAPWVFVLVYGSFIVLGAGLVVAFPAYVRARVGFAVRGTVGEVPPGVTHAAQVPLAWAAAGLAVALAVWRLSWAAGSGAGLRPETRDAWLRLGDVVTAAQVLCAAAGVLVLVHRWGGSRPFAVPLVATWIGAGGMLGTGFLSVPTILAGEDWAPSGQTFPAHATLTFATCLAGAGVSVVALFLVVERAAALSGAKKR